MKLFPQQIHWFTKVLTMDMKNGRESLGSIRKKNLKNAVDQKAATHSQINEPN